MSTAKGSTTCDGDGHLAGFYVMGELGGPVHRRSPVGASGRLASAFRSTPVPWGPGGRASVEPAVSSLVALEPSSARERQGGRVLIPASDSSVMVTGRPDHDQVNQNPTYLLVIF